MSWGILPYLVPHGVGLLVQALVLRQTLRHQEVRGSRTFSLAILGQVIWTGGYLCEILSSSLTAKITWDNIQVIGTALWAVALFAFALSYTATKLRRSAWVWAITGLVTTGYTALVFTDSLHRWVRPSVALIEYGPLTMLTYPFTWVTILAGAQALALLGASLVLLIRHSLRLTGTFRRQSALVAGGTSLPFVGAIATLSGLLPEAVRDISPLTFAAGDCLIAWGLLRHGLLDLAPVARELVFETLRHTVVVLDAKNRVVDVNEALLRVLGRRREEVIGRPDSEVFASWLEVVESLRQVENGSRVISTMVAGKLRYFEVEITPIRDDRQLAAGRVMVAHDVTQLKEAEQTLEERNAALRLAFSELDAFSRSVSHDLRAPVRAIAGFSKRLSERHAGALDGEALELTLRIESNARRMKQLIDDLLSLARLGRQELRKQPVQTAELVRQVIEELQTEATGRSIEFRLTELAECRADPSLLRQVFVNLIGNAVKYTRPRGLAQIDVNSARRDDAVVFCVADNGVGFDMAHADELFEVFRRLHSDSEFEGSGVGLATVQQIVRRHGGRIWAESEPGRGASFFFTLGA